MFRKIKMVLIGLGLSGAALVGAPDDARADYCREYTRTVYIGNRTQEAYGTACLQPDGSWMIVGEGLGNDIPSNVNDVEYVIRDNNHYVTPPRVVYYERRPTYYRSTPLFVWYHGGHYKGGHYYKYDKKRWDRHDRHGRWDNHRWEGHRGRGRGHGHR